MPAWIVLSGFVREPSPVGVPSDAETNTPYFSSRTHLSSFGDFCVEHPTPPSIMGVESSSMLPPSPGFVGSEEQAAKTAGRNKKKKTPTNSPRKARPDLWC